MDEQTDESKVKCGNRASCIGRWQAGLMTIPTRLAAGLNSTRVISGFARFGARCVVVFSIARTRYLYNEQYNVDDDGGGKDNDDDKHNEQRTMDNERNMHHPSKHPRLAAGSTFVPPYSTYCKRRDSSGPAGE